MCVLALSEHVRTCVLILGLNRSDIYARKTEGFPTIIPAWAVAPALDEVEQIMPT